MKSTFEKMGGIYTLGADGIYYPNLVSTDEEPHYGKYGIMRKTYLKEHRPAMYSLYMLEDRLMEHLNLVDDEAQERMDILVRQMMEKQGVTEELKARDQMVWVGAVNNIQNAAEEIVLKELIYIKKRGRQHFECRPLVIYGYFFSNSLQFFWLYPMVLTTNEIPKIITATIAATIIYE